MTIRKKPLNLACPICNNTYQTVCTFIPKTCRKTECIKKYRTKYQVLYINKMNKQEKKQYRNLSNNHQSFCMINDRMAQSIKYVYKNHKCIRLENKIILKKLAEYLNHSVSIVEEIDSKKHLPSFVYAMKFLGYFRLVNFSLKKKVSKK